MSSYVSNTTIPKLAQRILSATRIAITTHTRPDGDAMGSALALARALRGKGKTADVFLAGPIESNLITIAGRTPFRRVEHERPGDEYDLGIVVDTGAWSQLDEIAPWLKANPDRIVGIDHHTRGDDIASMRLVDPNAVSTTAMLAPLLDAMQCELTGGIGGVAEALFVGLATDSGWFRYGNAGPDAFALGARLLQCGVDKSRLYQILEETFGPQRLALEAKALSSLEFACGGSAAIQSLRIEDFKSTGASIEDLTGLVNTPMTVGAVRVSILLAQTELGKTKISFRSKPPAPRDQSIEAASENSISMPGGVDALTSSGFVDVNLLAQKFGGGGHIHAAGARIAKDIEQAKADVLLALQ